ncbi:MAG: DUF4396 domain-containing protein [Pseudomonadota bacterium]
MHHASHHDHSSAPRAPASLSTTAFWATVHCLSGCAVGEVLGMVLGTGFGLSNGVTIALSIVLAFVFGYAFTVTPLLRSGMAAKTAAGIALGADTASIALMELVDNLVMMVWPGAMDAGLTDSLFWVALAVSLLIAGAAAFPLNRFLISRGKGHALVHAHHGHAGHH